MQSTTNYSMNLVEGTDLVNIPVQLNPNFQTVDAEMFKNKQAGIGTATEVATGSVHAVVRSNTDADVFRFTATGAWTAGDTMTLDGSAVTVHLADGTAPATGAYIIGAEVVAVVNGTLVTLLTSNGAIDPGVTSFNSRTGAVTPSASDYDASMIDYDNTGSGLTATDCQSAIDEIAVDLPSYSTTTKDGVVFEKYGRIVTARIYGIAKTTLHGMSIPAGFEPVNVGARFYIATAIEKGSYYFANVSINTSNVIGCYYINPYGSESTSTAGMIYGTLVYISAT